MNSDTRLLTDSAVLNTQGPTDRVECHQTICEEVASGKPNCLCSLLSDMLLDKAFKKSLLLSKK